jgi:uncharacterized protein YjbJ (UPF0337 family)
VAKAKNTVQNVKGKVKEAARTIVGNDVCGPRAKNDQAKGNVKQAGNKMKDALKS